MCASGERIYVERSTPNRVSCSADGRFQERLLCGRLCSHQTSRIAIVPEKRGGGRPNSLWSHKGIVESGLAGRARGPACNKLTDSDLCRGTGQAPKEADITSPRHDI